MFLSVPRVKESKKKKENPRQLVGRIPVTVWHNEVV